MAIEFQQAVFGALVVDDRSGDLASGKALQGGDEITGLEVVRLTKFSHDVDHLVDGRGYLGKLFTQTGNEKVGDDAGKKIARPQNNDVGIGDGP